MNVIDPLQRSYYFGGIPGLFRHVSKSTILKGVDYKTGRLCQSKSDDVFGTYWLSVSDIVNSSAKVYIDFSGPEALTGICLGRWDKYVFHIEDHPLYKSMADRFLNNTPWDQTEYYKYCDEKIRCGGSAWNSCTSQNELRDRCEYIDNLYANIKKDGLLPWYERPNGQEYTRVGEMLVPDELLVGLDRNGRPIRLENGRHRLMIALLLDLQKIPAVITLCHGKYTSSDDVLKSDSVFTQIADSKTTKNAPNESINPED